MIFKKLITTLLILALAMSLFMVIPINAATLHKPEFKAVDTHINNILSMFEPTKEGDIIFATILNNKAVERLSYLTNANYANQDKYTDAIFMYGTNYAVSVEAYNFSLKNTSLTFQLSKPLENNEKLAVILDDGETVRFEKLTQKEYYDNMYWVYDVYASEYINVKVIAYTEETEGYYTMRYGAVLGEDLVAVKTASPYNHLFSFTLPFQAGDTIIDHNTNTIYIVLLPETDATNLTPTITYSQKASVLPSSQKAQDFTKDVVYTIIAEDSSAVSYTVKVKILNQTVVAPVYYPIISPYFQPYDSPFFPPYFPRYYPPVY